MHAEADAAGRAAPPRRGHVRISNGRGEWRAKKGSFACGYPPLRPPAFDAAHSSRTGRSFTDHSTALQQQAPWIAAPAPPTRPHDVTQPCTCSGTAHDTYAAAEMVGAPWHGWAHVGTLGRPRRTDGCAARCTGTRRPLTQRPTCTLVARLDTCGPCHYEKPEGWDQRQEVAAGPK